MIEFEEDPPPKGAPAWMATFADLMSLLVVFFVLLLSFSEMDVIRYKQLAESMKDAFGVQRELPLEQIPMGTSIIAQNFSPGRTDPTPLEQIQQITADPTKPDLEVGKRDASDSAVEDEAVLEAIQQRIMELDTQTRRDAEKLNETLAAEVQAGAVDIETNMTSITIRIRENGSFPSGSATLNEDFLPVMARLREALAGIGGKISVEGHTDNVPIGGGRFLSNWELSTGRAVSVAHELMRSEDLRDDRFMLIGYADTKPFTANDTPAGRALNRRVEIVIRQEELNQQRTELDMLLKQESQALDIMSIERDDP